MICELLSPRQFSPSNEPKDPRCRAGDGDIHIRHRQHAVAARNRDDRESGSNLCSFTKLGGIILGLSITSTVAEFSAIYLPCLRRGRSIFNGVTIFSTTSLTTANIITSAHKSPFCIVQISQNGSVKGTMMERTDSGEVVSVQAGAEGAHGGERSKATSAATSVSETGSIESRDGPVEGATRPTSTRERRAASLRAPRLAHTGGLLLFSAQHRSPGLLPQQPIRTT